MVEVLVLYYSKTGAVKELASYIARGINSIDEAEAKIRTVPEVSTDTEKSEDMIPEIVREEERRKSKARMNVASVSFDVSLSD